MPLSFSFKVAAGVSVLELKPFFCPSSSGGAKRIGKCRETTPPYAPNLLNA
jgi:hypothetical protein